MLSSANIIPIEKLFLKIAFSVLTVAAVAALTVAVIAASVAVAGVVAVPVDEAVKLAAAIVAVAVTLAAAAAVFFKRLSSALSKRDSLTSDMKISLLTRTSGNCHREVEFPLFQVRYGFQFENLPNRTEEPFENPSAAPLFVANIHSCFCYNVKKVLGEGFCLC
uniref:Uncharacterized protein n=1 Tax=Rhodnius prolixus TaxID=13249 RepID=T1IC56_RHOPR